MNLRSLIFTENACYKAGKRFVPQGIMCHSTGANNPYLKRYVGPDDGLLGRNVYGNHWNRLMDRQVCVHAFIGKLADGSIATYQTLPWDMRGWHSARGPKGSANDSHLGFEICEDNLSNEAYFRSVWDEAVGLCVHLCAMFGLDPMGDGVLIGHYEGHQRGIANNHADPRHWFSRFGESMDSFRADVKRELASAQVAPVKPETHTPEAAPGSSTPVESEYATHTVVKGDTLWRIAANKLGRGARYTEIKQLNALTSDSIYIGQTLRIPLK